MSDIEQAAERLGELPRDTWEWTDSDRKIAATFIDAYLRELASAPKDAHEPVTEEWLASVGNRIPTEQGDLIIEHEMPYVDRDDWEFVAYFCDVPNSDSCMLRFVRTRGDVYRLRAALGLPLNEGKTL